MQLVTVAHDRPCSDCSDRPGCSSACADVIHEVEVLGEEPEAIGSSDLPSKIFEELIGKDLKV